MAIRRNLSEPLSVSVFDSNGNGKKKKKKYPSTYTKKDKLFLRKQKEDIVRYEDLDEKGKAIWKKQGKPIPKAKSGKFIDRLAKIAKSAQNKTKGYK